MAEEVEVTNFGKGGVASEETLADLLKAVEYLAKKEGFDPKKTAEKIKELSENLDDTIEVIDENRKALEENTDALEENSRSIGNVFGLLGKAIGVVGTSLFNFSAELVDGGSTLSDFAQHIPIFGSLIARVTGYFDDTMTVFRDIASVGGAMNNSLTDIRMAAAQTYMSLDEFRNFVVSNSTQLAVMGGTVTKGVKRLTELNAALGNQRLELLNLGYSYQEINDALVRYAYLDRAGRRAQQINVAQQAAAAADYAKNLSTLSKLTGKEIESIEEKVQANTADVAFQQKLARMSPQERAKVLNAMAEATEIYGDAGAQFFKQQILGMPPLTEETQLLAAAFPDLANQIRGLAADAQDTRISLEQFNQGSTDRLVEAVKDAAEAGKDFETLLAAGAAGLDGPASALASILQGMGVQFTDFIENGVLDEEALRNAIESAKAETATRNKLTDALVQFEESIRNARKEILTTFMDSGVFELITDSVKWLADIISDPIVIGNLKDAIIDITNFFSDFIEDVKSEGFKIAILNAFKDIGQVIKDFLIGVTGQERQQRATQEISAIEDQIAQLQLEKEQLDKGSDKRSPAAQAEIERRMALIDQRIARLNENAQEQQRIVATPVEQLDQKGLLTDIVGPAIVSAGTTAIVEGFKWLFESYPLITGVTAAIAALWTRKKIIDAFSGVRDLLSNNSTRTTSSNTRGGNLFGGIGRGLGVGLRGLSLGLRALSSPTALLGLGALTLAINGIALAVRIASPGIEAFGSATKKIFEGLSAIAQSTGDLFEKFGNGVKSVFSGVSEVINSISSGIIGTIDSISNGISNVIGKITEYRTSGIEATTEQIQKLSSIPGSNLKDAADGIEAMKIALEDFKPGFWEGLGDWITGGVRFESMSLTTGSIQQLATTISSIDTTKIKEGSSALSDLSLALTNFTNAINIQSFGNLTNAIISGINDFLGVEDSFNTLKRFSEISINEEQLQQNVEAMNIYASVMSNLPKLPSFDVINSLKTGIVGLLGGETDPFAPMVRFSNMTLGPNTEANADAVIAFANAIQNMPQIDAGRSGGTLAAIGEWFTGSNIMPWDAVREFGSTQLDPQGYITANAEAITKFGTALDSFPQELSSMEISRELVNNLEDLALITGVGIADVANGLTELVSITGIQQKLDVINNGFDPTGVRTYATAIEELIGKMNELNEVLAESNDTLFRDNMSASKAPNINVSTQGNTEGLIELNNVMRLLHEEIVKNNDLTKKIERNTKSFGRDVATGRVSDL